MEVLQPEGELLAVFIEIIWTGTNLNRVINIVWNDEMVEY